MLVYTFEKSFLDRMDEIKIILEVGGESVKNKFKDFIETSIEPAGYGAIWKISRASCEELNVKYPCEVYGSVENSNFDELSATFLVESVQDESIHLPEVCTVPLEDLYPTIEQENSALNADLTADCLDRFRFFFKYIILPWDDDQDDFAQKLIEPRMKLFFDLKNKKISKGLSSHIRGIINEAKYIQQSRENLENSFEDSDIDIDLSRGESKEKARKLLQLHFRMNQIKHDIDILTNPEMRVIYEEIKFPKLELNNEKKIFVVNKTGSLKEQIQLIEELKRKVNDVDTIHWLSLQEAISNASHKSEILVPSGEHKFNFLEYLNGDILISGIPSISIYDFQMEQLDNYAKITPTDSGYLLLAVDGDLSLENLIIDCEKVKTGILIKDGKVSIKNCVIFGSKESSVTEGITVSGDVEVLIENSIIMNFATAISVSSSASVNIRHSVIKNCNNGIQLLVEDAKVILEKTSMLNCDSGIIKYSTIEGDKGKTLDWNDTKEAEL